MEPLLMIILLLLPLAALVAVWYLVSTEFARIAADKGYPDRHYFHYCFWLGLVGILMIVAMPDKKSHIANPSVPATPGSSGPRPPVTTTDTDAPRRPPEQAASVPVAFARDPQSAAPAPAAHNEERAVTQKTVSVLAKLSGKATEPGAPTTWKCTCRALNPISATICDKCRSTWRCSCGKVNPRNTQRCPSCWAWRCVCGTTNTASKGMCEKCNAPKPR